MCTEKLFSPCILTGLTPTEAKDTERKRVKCRQSETEGPALLGKPATAGYIPTSAVTVSILSTPALLSFSTLAMIPASYPAIK